MSFRRTIIASALMLLTLVCLRYLSHAENIQPNKPFSTFPKEIGGWIGKESRFDDEIYEILGVSDSFLGNYRSSAGGHVQLYIGFYQSQKEGIQIHSPKNCLPGGGWNITRSSTEELTLPGQKPDRIRVAKLNIRQGDQKQIVLYWMQSRGRFISSEYMQKFYRVIDSIIKHRTDGAFVRLITPVINGNEAKALQETKGFVRVLMPVLHEYLPS